MAGIMRVCLPDANRMLHQAIRGHDDCYPILQRKAPYWAHADYISQPTYSGRYWTTISRPDFPDQASRLGRATE